MAETNGGGEYFQKALRRHWTAECEPRDRVKERMTLDVAHATASWSQTITRIKLEQLQDTRRRKHQQRLNVWHYQLGNAEIEQKTSMKSIRERQAYTTNTSMSTL